MVQIVSGPELHGEAPGEEVFRESAPKEWAIEEDAGSPLLVHVSVPEHWRMGVIVSNSRGLGS